MQPRRRRRSCVVCEGPLGPEVNALLATGWTPNRIETALRRSGLPCKRETIAAHKRECLGGDAVGAIELQELGDAVERGDFESEAAFRRDLAVLVQRRVIRALARGALGVTTSDGLKAQALIDRRAERQQGQEFMLNLARLLSGGGQPAPARLIGDGVARESR